MGIASGAFGYQTPRKKFGVETVEPFDGSENAWQTPNGRLWPGGAATNHMLGISDMPGLSSLNERYGQGPMSRTTQRAPGGQIMQAVIPAGQTQQQGGQQQGMNWENGRAVVGDNTMGLGNTAKDGWNFVPRPSYNRAMTHRMPPDMGDTILRRGHLGFADNLQGQMDRMLDVNLSNQQASLANKNMWLNYLLGRDQAAASVEAEKIRAMALAAALGSGGGHGGKPRMMSNIGQSINPWG